MALSESEEFELLQLERERSLAHTAASDQPAPKMAEPSPVTQPPLQALGNATQQGFNQAGQNINENLASGVSIKPGIMGNNAPFPMNMVPGVGLPSAQPTPGQGMRTLFEVVVGVGIMVQMIPDIAQAVLTGGLGSEAGAAGDLGKIGRIVSGPGRAEAGAAMGEAEAAAGVHPDIIPTIKDVTANLGLKNANAKQYLNALMERLKSGEPMSAEALSQHHKMLSELLSKEPSGFGKIISGSKLGGPAVAQAAKADSLVVQQLNEAVTGRADAAANYAAAMQRGNIYKGAAGLGAAALGRNVILDAFNKLTGRR